MQTLWSPRQLFFPCPLERYAMELEAKLNHFLDLLKKKKLIFLLYQIYFNIFRRESRKEEGKGSKKRGEEKNGKARKREKEFFFKIFTEIN